MKRADAITVDAKIGSDENHGRACGAHDICDNATDREEKDVRERARLPLDLYMNPSGHHEERAVVCLERLGLLIDHPTLQRTDELFMGLEEFRQHLGGRLTVTMLEGVGRPIDVHEVDRVRMVEAIQIVVDRVARIAAAAANV